MVAAEGGSAVLARSLNDPARRRSWPKMAKRPWAMPSGGSAVEFEQQIRPARLRAVFERLPVTVAITMVNGAARPVAL